MFELFLLRVVSLFALLSCNSTETVLPVAASIQGRLLLKKIRHLFFGFCDSRKDIDAVSFVSITLSSFLFS